MKALKRVVFWQFGTSAFCCLIAWISGGSAAALSSLLGGLVCAVPSLFIVGLMFLIRDRTPSPAGIFIFEFIKVSLIILGFLSVALFYEELNWLAFMLSAGAVLLSHIFALASRN